jgi:antitoxin (DNA-binding transcriptional repressor) of toxin-antitoxin stability system
MTVRTSRSGRRNRVPGNLHSEGGRERPVVVTDDGQPVAALVMLEHTDLETVPLSSDPEFLELIRSSRARHAQEGGLSSAEVRRRLGSVLPSRRRTR